MSTRNKKLFRRLKKPFRLLIVNENTLEEKASFLLTPLNILLLVSSFLLVFFILTYSIITYSALGKYIPGSTSGRDKSDLIEIQKKLDEIERQHKTELRRRNDIINVLSGSSKSMDTISMEDPLGQTETTELPARDRSTDRNRGGMNNNDFNFEGILLFAPLKGKISQGFDINTHQAVDITPIIADESVKATLEGTVIFTGWTPDFGHVIQIQHAGNLQSIYKHNAYLHKKIGDYVRTGEVIAVAGNTGELSTGTHLHFELWYNGRALNPQKWISF